MSVLIFLDQADGHIKKSSFEAAGYGAAVAKQTGTAAEAVVLGTVNDDLASLGNYGITKVHTVTNEALNHVDAQGFTKIIAEVAIATGATVIVFSNNFNGKAIAPRLSVRLKAGLVSGAIALPDTTNGFTVQKNVFSGKAFANVTINTAIKIISLNPNSFTVATTEGIAEVAPFAATIEAPKVQVTATDKVVGEVPLSEAEIVVSGGRGLKGPENWGLVTDLAKLLGAATACSRPVADIGWRPHHEHVGQTGLAIAPNLYFAIGISGAIQHLAGVNRSKTIVVINKDPEAPFFKAADYGIVGDAFEIMPKIIEAVKQMKQL
ncbi:electron transfer flavoprotein subunit alpha/FixB family protein [Ferruginibacter paludis]|uniref:electron transfer flavoprotein subunit alpha/FixB family protein n=1 Tax=Ferruginibacter paludis TaxID=1310417 RepID=UPI0025B2FBDA|nr:electron transfer flavoprotein subunit alpha/FixB family protein [Ferruginibacter paludis]MDN3657080.1 electron transfer flavoprotein subunit alpha/FixB family protein [Ferruginibacter paludis]